MKLDISKLKDLEIGHNFKKYKYLCNYFNLEVKTSANSKIAQLKEIGRYCTLEKNGHKLKIKEIYESPLPKIDGRGLSFGVRGNNTKYDPISVSHPNLVKEWDYGKNKFSPNEITKCSSYSAWWICKECNYEWKALVEKRAYRNSGCPVCKGSKGERKVSSFLRKNKLPFKFQYKFNDLRGINNQKLRFDFSVFNEDGSLKCLIEYDGQYHYKVVDGDVNSYQELLEHDRRKNEYCHVNNIELIRIPYTHYNLINEILSVELKIDSFKPDLLSKSKSDIVRYYEWVYNGNKSITL